MLGFKTADEMNLEECYRFLVKEPGNEAIEARFEKLVSVLSLRKSFLFLRAHKDEGDNSYYQKVKGRYEKLVDNCRKREKRDYSACETIDDYERFIGKYKAMKPEYQAAHIVDAQFSIKVAQECDDFEACETIADYDNFINKYEALAQEGYHAANLARAIEVIAELEIKAEEEEQQRLLKIKRLKKRLFFVSIAVIIVAAIIVFFAGFRPLNVLYAEIQEREKGKWKEMRVDTLEFGKEGKEITVRIVAKNVLADAIDVSLPETEWLTADISRKRITLKTEPNEEGHKECDIQIKAYPTCYGKRIRIQNWTKSITIHIAQESGLASQTVVEPKRLDYSWIGGTQEICVKTDGVKTPEIHIDDNSWVQCNLTESGLSEGFYHDNKYQVSVNNNTDSCQRKNSIVVNDETIDIVQDGTEKLVRFDSIRVSESIPIRLTNGEWVSLGRQLHINAKITIRDNQNEKCRVYVYFYHEDGRKMINPQAKKGFRLDDNQVCCYEDIIPTSISFDYDISIYIPISELLSSNKKIKYQIRIKNMGKNCFVGKSTEFQNYSL